MKDDVKGPIDPLGPLDIGGWYCKVDARWEILCDNIGAFMWHWWESLAGGAEPVVH